MKRTIRVAQERWALAETFTISRGSKTAAEVILVEIEQAGVAGRGECVPYARYGETLGGVRAAIEAQRQAFEGGISREGLRQAMPPGAARNALDCALWDLEAKQAGARAWQLAGLPAPQPVITAYTLSLGPAEKMGQAAARHAHRPLLKLKLDDDRPIDRVRAVRDSAPHARIIIDANEAWSPASLADRLAACAELAVELVEQPLPADADSILTGMESPVAIAADEACHTERDLARVADRYQVVNIKLDKTGGLTEALRLRAAALERGLGVMVGCMVGTSLAMAPATLLAPGARFVDLDGPLLLAEDRRPGLDYDDRGRVSAPPSALWG